MKILSLFNKKKDLYSQSGQDQFAYNLIGKNGTYLEIGAFDPILNSNTYNLETKCNWKGLSVEFDLSHKDAWNRSYDRKNKILWTNAFSVNYLKELNKIGISNNIDYLSCDIEPPENTFKILKLLIQINLQFSFISYEHDKYNYGDKYEKLSKEFLINHGYKIAVDNVYSRNKKYKIYETWFVNNKIEFEQIDYQQWRDKKFSSGEFKTLKD